LENKICPYCNGILEIKNNETYNYDPIVFVEVTSYFCPICGHEEEIEHLGQLR